jgi:hypothetical protein
MKSRRSSADPKVPIEPRNVVRRKRKEFATDQDKWLFPAATTTLHVALPNEWIADIDGALGDLRPVLRDREDFVSKACEYALESWQEGISTPEGKELLALARRSRRWLARKKKKSR